MSKIDSKTTWELKEYKSKDGGFFVTAVPTHDCELRRNRIELAERYSNGEISLEEYNAHK